MFDEYIKESTNYVKQIEGRYANFFKIGFNAFEFLIDFCQFFPEVKQAQIHTRIITSPVYMKALFDTLKDSIEKYEKIFGVIKSE